MRRNILYVWAAGFLNGATQFVKNTRTNKIAHIATGHHVCKTPPACIILFGMILVLNHILASYAF